MRTRAASEGVLAVSMAMLVIAAAAVFGSGRDREADLRASSWIDDRRGAHALHLLLDALGLGPQRLVEPVRPSSPVDRTVVVLAPSEVVTKAEARELLEWTERGGRLVVAGAPSAPPILDVDVRALLVPLGLELRPAGGAALRVTIADERLAEAAPGVKWPAALVLARRDPKAEPFRDRRAEEPADLVICPEGTLAARVHFGLGEVVVLADASLVSNDLLDEQDNAVLAVALIAPEGSGPIAFDEYHHGFTPTGTRAGLVERIWALLVGTWIGRAMFVLALAAVVWAAGAGVRLGAPLPEPAAPRRALREHADALGRLLEGARSTREALTILVDGVRRSVATRVGERPGATAELLASRLEGSIAPGAAELAEAVRAAHAGAGQDRMEDAAFARLAANLGAAKRRFLHGGG